MTQETLRCPSCGRPDSCDACRQERGDQREAQNRDLVHDWFSLSYAHYLVYPRVLLQNMPGDWQRRFVQCLNELNETWSDEAFPNYRVRRVVGECERSCDACRDEPSPKDDECTCGGCEYDIPDDLSDYRHPSLALIASLRRRAPEC